MQTCFFSHSWEDATELKELLKNEIELRSDNRIDVIYDKCSFIAGDNILQKEKLILSADVVVVFFSPSYKTAVTLPDVSKGVYREYSLILQRMKDPNLFTIPILLSGKKETSIPADFIYKVYEDLSSVVVYTAKNKAKAKYVAKRHELIMKKLVNNIINKAEDSFFAKSNIFTTEEEKYENLFYITESQGNLPRECMVLLDVYQHIRTQVCYFAIGRKGSGKTTLLEIIENFDTSFHQKYKNLNPISVQDINLEYLYSVLDTHKRDVIIIPESLVLNLFWEIYISLITIYIVGIEVEHGRINDERESTFNNMKKVLLKKLNVQALDKSPTKKAISDLGVELLDNFLRSKILNYATEAAFVASITANTNSFNILSTFFGKNVFKNFLVALNKCKKRILIGLDGFDSTSDDFSRQTNEFSISERNIRVTTSRVIFECLFYRSLIDTVRAFKKTKKKSFISPIEDLLDFCIVLPQDRVDKIEIFDRDISKVNFAGLYWDAIELLKIVVLRLEYLADLKDQKGDLKARFDLLMSKLLPHVPDSISIRIGNFDKSMDIFRYILRLSSWNPRYVLKHVARLYSASKVATEKISNDTIKTILNYTGREIIRKEFIKEYCETIINIEDILLHFQDFDFINDFFIFCNHLDKISFQTASTMDLSKTDKKLAILYKLGIIGIYIPRELAQRQGFGTEYCYIFNEGLEPLESNIRDFSPTKQTISIVFNPIYCKYLALRINTNEVIGDFSWEYLKENKTRNMVIRRY